MRKWLLVLLFLFLLGASPCWADGLVIGWPAAGGGETQVFADTFSDNQGASPTGWTTGLGSTAINETGGQLVLTCGGNCTAGTFYTGAATGNIKHYMQTTMVSFTGAFPGWGVRYPNGAGNWYAVSYNATTGIALSAYNATTWQADAPNAVSTTIATGSVIKVKIEGTGTGTKIYVYDDGVLIDKGNGTTFDFSVDGDRPQNPDNTYFYADTGQYVGLNIYDEGIPSMTSDNFSGGTW